MLTALRLGNFKAFADTQTIPLRPLTLIFGPNSSGKSSIIHGLLFAHEANRTGELDVHQSRLGGETVDLGGFSQFAYRGHGPSGDITWGAQIEPTRSQVQHISAVLGMAPSVSVSVSVGLLGGSMLHSRRALAITSYALALDGRPFLRASVEPDLDWGLRGIARLRLRELDRTHPLLNSLLSRISGSRKAGKLRHHDLALLVDQAVSEIVMERSTLVPTEAVSCSADRGEGLPSEPSALGKTADREAVGKFLDDLVRCISMVLSDELARVSYLGPIRCIPPREIGFAPELYVERNAVGGSPDGRKAYELAAHDPRVRDAINIWLGSARMSTPYVFEVQRLWDESAYRDSIEDGINWANAVREDDKGQAHDPGSAFEIGEFPDRWRRVVLIDRRTGTPVSLRDVGIGISQVVPVLVSALGSEGRTIAIEQPEIHLHPALQAELADVFIESALGERKNMFILETHSEHLILRVMRRMRDTVRGQRGDAPPVRPEDVAVLFVEPTAKGSIVHELRLKPDGSLLDPWPGGFFEESFSEIFG